MQNVVFTPHDAWDISYHPPSWPPHSPEHVSERDLDSANGTERACRGLAATGKGECERDQAVPVQVQTHAQTHKIKIDVMR